MSDVDIDVSLGNYIKIRSLCHSLIHLEMWQSG